MSATARHLRPSCGGNRPPLPEVIKPACADLTETETEQCPAQKADERFVRTLFALRDMRLDRDFSAALSLVQGLERQLRSEQLDGMQSEAGVVG